MSDIRSFLDTVSRQIRWKRARGPLLRELESHITDRRDALAEDGAEIADAEAQAVSEMGDPEDIGLALDRLHRPRPNRLLIGCTAGLLLMGIVLLWAVGDRDTYLAPMLVYSGVGIAALIGGYFLDYTLLAKIPCWVLFALCGVCVVFPVMGNLFLSAAAQICYILPLFFIPLVYRARSGEVNDVTLMVLGAAACFIAAVFSRSWMSLCAYIVVVCGGMIIHAAAKGWLGRWKRTVLLWITIPPALAFAFLCFISRSSLENRLMYGMLNPGSDPMGLGWLPLRVRELISTSRLFGEGTSSELLDSFIAPNDICSVEHLLAVASHRYGSFLFILVAALTVAAGVMLVVGIKRQSCRLGSLTLLTIGLGFGLRAVMYFVSNLGFTFIYFEGLPLFSYCGKLMVPDMLAMGLLLSVFRSESIARDKPCTGRKTAIDC